MKFPPTHLINLAVVFARDDALATSNVDGELVAPLAVLHAYHRLLLAEEDLRAEGEENRALERLRMVEHVQVVLRVLKVQPRKKKRRE